MPDDNSLTGGSSGDDSTPSSLTKWKNILGFFILGLVNHYPYVMMLSAALDIMHRLEQDGTDHTHNSTNISSCTLLYNETTNVTSYPSRDLCNREGTSVILLADIVPAVIISLVAPYFMHFIPYWIKIFSVIVVNSASFVIVALSSNKFLVLFGVVCASIGVGFGDLSFLSLTSHYHKSTVSGWSSGTGCSGVISPLVYAGLSLFLSTKVTLLAQVFSPALLFFSYMFLLGSPQHSVKSPSIHVDPEVEDKDISDTTPLIQNKSHSSMKKIKLFNKDEAKYWLAHVKYTPHLIKYMVPLFIVYLSQYTINQGLFQFLYNANTHIGGYCMDQRSQYRWLQFAFGIGVFLSRSSLSIVYIKHFWILSLLQVVNLVFFFVATIYLFIPSYWLTLVIVVYEGLLGGGVYVNAMYTVYTEVPDIHREYSMSVMGMAVNGGIFAAGTVSIFSHWSICEHFIGYVHN